MKYISWNVNGFRAVLKKGFLSWLENEDPDVLCLQEIRAEWEELELSTRRHLESAYDLCWFPAKSKKGYAGSATLTRKGSGWSHSPGIGEAAFDQEGRLVVSRRENQVLLAGYFPNASTGLVRLPYKRAFSEAVVARVCQWHEEGLEVIVVGDTNVAPEEIDLARPADNRLNPGFTDEEREDFRRYLDAGLVDILRSRHPGQPGLYTWWTARGGARARNVGWRIDQFLVSRSLAPRVVDAGIRAEILGSDHCPIYLITQ